MTDKSQANIRKAQTDTGAGVAEHANFEQDTTQAFDRHPVREDIAQLRCNLPFVPVLPWPKAGFRADLANAGDNIEVPIPDQAVLMKLSGTGAFFANILGRADGQTSAQLQTAGQDGNADILVSEPATDWLYVAGLKSVSVRTVANTNKIGARFLFRDQL